MKFPKIKLPKAGIGAGKKAANAAMEEARVARQLARQEASAVKKAALEAEIAKPSSSTPVADHSAIDHPLKAGRVNEYGEIIHEGEPPHVSNAVTRADALSHTDDKALMIERQRLRREALAKAASTGEQGGGGDDILNKILAERAAKKAGLPDFH